MQNNNNSYIVCILRRRGRRSGFSGKEPQGRLLTTFSGSMMKVMMIR
jgi:hypothetical protein